MSATSTIATAVATFENNALSDVTCSHPSCSNNFGCFFYCSCRGIQCDHHLSTASKTCQNGCEELLVPFVISNNTCTNELSLTLTQTAHHRSINWFVHMLHTADKCQYYIRMIKDMFMQSARWVVEVSQADYIYFRQINSTPSRTTQSLSEVRQDEIGHAHQPQPPASAISSS